MIVVDASALLEVLLVTERGARVEARLFRPREVLCAPHVIDLEIAQVLRRYATTGDLTPARGREALDDLTDFPIVRYSHQVLLRRIWALRDNVTAYDAAYLALAEALESPFVTCDGRLARAAGHAARVEVI